MCYMLRLTITTIGHHQYNSFNNINLPTLATGRFFITDVKLIYCLWIRNQIDDTFVLFFISLLLAQHVSGNHVPIFRS